jgi:hypothetical protein
MEDRDRQEDGLDFDTRYKDEIYSKVVRAGKRTYFFDVKPTRRNEFYLTITESKKRFEQDGNFYFEKHKIFLYREDFDKFIEGLQEVMTFVDQNNDDDSDYQNESPDQFVSENEVFAEVGTGKNFTNLDFETL